MSAEQAGVAPSCRVYTQHGRLVVSAVGQWRPGQKRCPGGTQKGYEHGPEDETRHYDKAYTLPTILQWANVSAKDAVSPVSGEAAPGLQCGKDRQQGQCNEISQRWSPTSCLTFRFLFRFLHRKTLTPDCHKYVPAETNFFPLP